MKSLGRDLWLKLTKARKNKKNLYRVKADKNLRLTQVLKEFSIAISTFYYELKKEDFDRKMKNYKPSKAYFWEISRYGKEE
ncbi:transposase InsK [Mesomycoplasma hyorhinis MCLD]|uniref:Transposase InsK n=1 Tax=Mesomycoplasma hyorhinis (strain MCLD) TaxID=936139 RepID=A0ABM5M674_MESHM|nr:transposase InsK [Mesomycoplasma hyorhinis MCLD]